jgi:tetratricopeptide (TPR) repeat protein
MTKRTLITLLAALLAIATVSAFAQENAGTVKGKAIDEKAKPLFGATVVLQSADGKKINIKADKNGEFERTGVPAGSYKVELLVDGKPRWGADAFAVAGGQTAVLIIDMAAAAAAASMTAEQKKQLEEQQKKAEQERSKIKNLNAILAQAKKMETAGDVDGALGLYEQAVQADPTKDLLWANLGSAYLLKVQKTSDKVQSADLATKAADALQKALAIKPNDAGYHNNLGQAYARSDKTADALKEFTTAAQMDPTGAARYYFNAGAILTNESTKMPPSSAEQKQKINDANEMFRKSIAADPKYSDGEAYYQLATNLLSMATMSKDGKMIVPDGTTDAYQKYLDTAPSGRFAESVKATMAALGTTVETTYKKTGSKKK